MADITELSPTGRMSLVALNTLRREREWREVWASEGTDWRTAFGGHFARALGQRHSGDGWMRVADSCEIEHFARTAS